MTFTTISTQQIIASLFAALVTSTIFVSAAVAPAGQFI